MPPPLVRAAAAPSLTAIPPTGRAGRAGPPPSVADAFTVSPLSLSSAPATALRRNRMRLPTPTEGGSRHVASASAPRGATNGRHATMYVRRRADCVYAKPEGAGGDADTPLGRGWPQPESADGDSDVSTPLNGEPQCRPRPEWSSDANTPVYRT
eukprot:gene3434-4229_t